MNGSEAGAQGTGLLVELRLHVSSSLLHPLNPPHPLASDYIIKEKTVLLQKKDSEGFGFVLRGAKGECRPGRRWGKGSLIQGDGQGKGPQPTPHPIPGCWSLSYGEASVTWV